MYPSMEQNRGMQNAICGASQVQPMSDVDQAVSKIERSINELTDLSQTLFARLGSVTSQVPETASSGPSVRESGNCELSETLTRHASNIQNVCDRLRNQLGNLQL